MDNAITELEKQCLEALQHNFPQLQRCNGALVFMAEADATQLTATAWQFDASTHELLKQSGLKSALLDMLDTLVAERKQHRVRPNREGKLIISAGQCQLKWLAPGEGGLVISECA